MGLPVTTQIKAWGVASAALLLVLWALGDAMMPFLLGAAIAYFLNPIADRLQQLTGSRALAVTLIMLGVIVVFTALTLLVSPVLVEQAVALFDAAPDLARDLRAFLTERFPVFFDNGAAFDQSLAALGDTIRDRGTDLLETVVTSAASLVNLLIFLVIVPVIAFYLLYDWHRMITAIDDMLPREHAPVIRDLAAQIDRTLASFVRGMGTVCLILGTFYAIALMLVGLQFGLVVGAIAGLVTFIPYLGAIIGGVLAIGLALFQFWGDWVSIALVAGIFVSGQLVEGNLLTPKLVGSSVGLHPVWLIFALSVFGVLFGFVGLLVAVPLAAALGVLARFFLQQYKHSRLYLGVSESGDE